MVAQTLAANSGNPGWTADSVFNDGGSSTDWQDEIYRTGVTYSNNVGFSGGNDKSAYYASLTNANWQGVMKGTEKERTIAKVNLTHKAFKERLVLSVLMREVLRKNFWVLS